MAGLSLSLLAVVATVAWFATRPETYVAPRPDASGPSVAPEAAAAALDALAAAVRSRDSDAADQLAAPGDAAASAQLIALAVNAGLLHVEDFTLRYVDEASGISPEGTWTAAVDATWAFDGFDDAPARAEVLVTFRVGSGADAAQIVSIGGGDRRTPIWMDGPVTVRRTPRTLVLVAGEPTQLAGYQRIAEAAIGPVTRVLPVWRPRLVVEVPADLAGLESALDVDPGSYASIAAVTASPDGLLAPDAPLHVFINPEVFDRSSEQGDQVVMTHEAAHVATRAPESMAPKWLVEGFADYIALRGIDLPLSRTAAQIIAQVREQGVPPTLPGQEDFASTEAHLGAAYEAAWLVCVVLAERGGEAALVRFYDEAGAGGPLNPALQAEFGWTERDLVAAWQQHLRSLASASNGR